QLPLPCSLLLVWIVVAEISDSRLTGLLAMLSTTFLAVVISHDFSKHIDCGFRVRGLCHMAVLTPGVPRAVGFERVVGDPGRRLVVFDVTLLWLFHYCLHHLLRETSVM